MSLIDRAKVTPTGQIRAIPTRMEVDLQCEKTGEIRPYTLDQNVEYEMRLTAAVRFWVNGAQLDRHIEMAKRALLHQMHQDVLSHIAELQMAVSGHDYESATRLCIEIKKDLGLLG